MAAHYVVRRVDRAEPEVIAALGDAGVATVHEAAGRVGLLGPTIQARQGGVTIAGSAITVSCHPGDNLMIHAAVEVCRAGDILVVTTTSPASTGAAVAEAAARRLRNEETKRAQLAGGTLGIDLYGLRPLPRDLGVAHVDRLPDDGPS